MEKKRNLLYLAMGIAVGLLVLPLLSALGVPGFEVLLTSMFGEGSLWAIVFTVLLIALIIFGMNRAGKKEV